MEKANSTPRKSHFWSGKFRLTWDTTTMPMINQDLHLTKNEITLQVFKVKNSERAGKVLAGASTDMEDIMNLCNHYSIDICQFMRLSDGSHPVMLHRDEYLRLKAAASETEEDEKEPETDTPAETVSPSAPEATSAPEMRYLNDANVGQLIALMKEQDAKIAALYERIVELTAQNATLRSQTKDAYLYGQQQVADDSQLQYKG